MSFMELQCHQAFWRGVRKRLANERILRNAADASGASHVRASSLLRRSALAALGAGMAFGLALAAWMTPKEAWVEGYEEAGGA